MTPEERAKALFHDLEDMMTRFGNAITATEKESHASIDYIASLKAAEVSLSGALHRMQRLVYGTW